MARSAHVEPDVDSRGPQATGPPAVRRTTLDLAGSSAAGNTADVRNLFPAPPTQTPPPSSVPPETAVASLPDLTIYETSEKIKTTRFHIVRKDETLSAISQQYYGSPNQWRKIVEASKGAVQDANKIRPGTKLIIPD